MHDRYADLKSVRFWSHKTISFIFTIHAYLFGNALKCFLSFINCLCGSIVDDNLTIWLLKEKDFVTRFCKFAYVEEQGFMPLYERQKITDDLHEISRIQHKVPHPQCLSGIVALT